MASANVPAENPFLTQIDRVRVELRERVARAHQVLRERETALLSELQQLEVVYRRVINSRTSLESASDRMRRVELRWDTNLGEILSRASSIRVVSDYSVKESSAILADNKTTKTRHQAARETKTKQLLTANNDVSLSKCNENHSLPLTTKESRMDISQTTNSNNLKNGENHVGAENASIFSTSIKDSQINPTNPTSSMKAFYSSQTNCKPAYTSTTVQYSDTSSKNNTFLRILLSPITPITPKKYIYKPTCTTSKGSHVSKDDPRQHTRPIPEGIPTLGLKNLGNTCYMNSILQCLSHTLPLRQLYVSDGYKQYLNTRKGDLSSVFKRVMLELWDTTYGHPVSPYYLKRQVGIAAPMFSDYNQHDAHEFMRFLLNELHEEINRASEEGRKSPADSETLGEACARYLTWEDSRISQLFSGMLRSDVCCSVCRHTSTAYIPFLDLSLPIPEREQRPCHLYSIEISLNECLTVIITIDTLTGEDRPYCNNCKNLTPSTKQLAITKLPKFLVIQLKRFSYYPKPTKLSTPVKFNDTWILKDNENAYKYSLYGIVSHSGSMHGGHYTAYCKYKEDWRCFNDIWAYIVSWEQVKLQEAYILFYRRHETCATSL